MFIIFPLSIYAQTDLDEVLAPIDFLDEIDTQSSEDQQYILEITQTDAQIIAENSSLTPQEQESFHDYGYVIRRFDDESGKPASLHFSIDSTLKSFDLVPGKREDINPTSMTVSTSDSTGYQLISSLKNQLQTTSGNVMPLTSCNDECNARIAGLWSKEDAYGWGYTLDGVNYKPFDVDGYELLSKKNYLNKEDSTTMELAVFPSTIQPLGTYKTTIQIIALPW